MSPASHRRLLVALDDDTSSARVADFVNDFFGGGMYEILAINVAPVPLPYHPGVAYGAVTPFVWPGGFPPGASAETLELEHVVSDRHRSLLGARESAFDRRVPARRRAQAPGPDADSSFGVDVASGPCARW